MTPSSRLGASLLSSVVLAWPALEACLRDELPLDIVLVRWAAAFFVAWIAFGMLGRLVDTYRVGPDEPGADGSERRRDPADAAPDVVRQRRVEDGPLNAS